MKLEELYEVIIKRAYEKPEGSYVANLIKEGVDRIAQKVGEETVEVIIAAKNTDKKRIISEAADLLFHLLILLQQSGVSLDDIYLELSKRSKK